MPSEKYNFIPAEGMRSFKGQAAHIGNGFCNQLVDLGLNNVLKIDRNNKKTVITSFSIIFDTLISYLKIQESVNLKKEAGMWYGSSTYLRILNLMDNHLAHHRGQMIVYLRLKGIKPPTYIGW